MRDYANFAQFSPQINSYDGSRPNDPEDLFTVGFNPNAISSLTRNLSQGVGGKNDGETVLAGRKIPCYQGEKQLTEKLVNGFESLDQPGLQVVSRLLKKMSSVVDGLRWGAKSIFADLKGDGDELSAFGNIATNSRIMDARVIDNSAIYPKAVFDFVLESDPTKGGTVQVEFEKKDHAYSKPLAKLKSSDIKEVKFTMKKVENLLDPEQVLERTMRFDVRDPESQIAKGMGKWLGFLEIHKDEVGDNRLSDLHADMQVF
jgi:hypothetical protein